MLTGNNGKPIRGELKHKGAIAETHLKHKGNNREGSIGDPWR
jgi:hypothetical protein